MSVTVEVIVGDEVYDLTDNVNFITEGVDGWGMAPVKRLSQAGPMQHGVSDVGFRLQPRTIPLLLVAPGAGPSAEGSESDWFAGRSSLLDIFKPSNSPVNLRVTDPRGYQRQIDCFFQDGMEMPIKEGDPFGRQRAAVTLFCPDPTWYDPVAGAITFNLGGGGASGVVPLLVPMPVGASTLDVTMALAYEGSWLAYPQVRITGPITNCVISNDTTGEKLDFTGLTITAGHYYDIDCRYGYKTIKDDAGANQISKLTSDSDLATFCIEANPIAPGGVNSIRVKGSGVTAATQLDMTWFTRFVGI